MNRSIKTPNDSRHGSTNKALLVRLRGLASVVAVRFSTAFKNADGAELLEFALALPLILVMVAGLLDFARAYNIKQKLANAAREGARYIAVDDKDISASTPASVQTMKDDVVTYLTNAGVDTSFIGTAMSYDPSTGVCTGTYYTTNGGVNYGLKVERCVSIPDSSSVSIQSSRVTLYYPYDWTFGFNSIIKLLIPSATFTNPINIQADATMSDFQ